MRKLVVAFLLVAGSVSAEDLSKATRGLVLSSDCEQEICHAYRLTVSQKFVRLPIKRQLSVVRDFCRKLDKGAEDYEEEDGTPWVIQSCIFAYNGQDIAAQTLGGRVEVEPWYIAALAALRDPK